MRVVSRFIAIGALFLAACELLVSSRNSVSPAPDGGPHSDGGPSSDGGPGQETGGPGCVGDDAGIGVVVPIPGDAGSYCIDATEVTQGAYLKFLYAVADAGPQADPCSWNTSYNPTGLPPNSWPPTSNSYNLPIAGVDWCDAIAFCTWAGKRLCGQIDGDMNAPGALADPTQSEWYNACAQGRSKLLYPYGNTYDASTCNCQEAQLGELVPVRHESGCVGGFPNIFDMSGNAAEWENSCDPPSSPDASADHCLIRGGSWKLAFGQSTCAVSNGQLRNFTNADLGFRCCADLK